MRLEAEKTVKKEDSNIIVEQLIKSRSVLIFGEITQELAGKVASQLLVLDAMSADPIKVFINSQGGHVESGDTIHDIIKYIGAPVYTIGTGWVASAGTTIYLAAKKENRFSLPNTRYLIHQPMGGVRGQVSDIGIEAEEMLKMRARVNRLISEATGQPLDRVEKDTDRNYWMSTEKAVEYGIVGKIITTATEIPG